MRHYGLATLFLRLPRPRSAWGKGKDKGSGKSSPADKGSAPRPEKGDAKGKGKGWGQEPKAKGGSRGPRQQLQGRLLWKTHSDGARREPNTLGCSGRCFRDRWAF